MELLEAWGLASGSSGEVFEGFTSTPRLTSLAAGCLPRALRYEREGM